MNRHSASSVSVRSGFVRAVLGGLWIVGAVTGSELALHARAEAQVAMHREVPRGEVTGLEMGIEGSLQATPGAPVRWWITLYEVVRRRELRPAPGCSVRAMSSHQRGEPIVSVTTDPHGRAALVMPMPDDLEQSPNLILDAVCPRGVRRLFDVGLSLEGRERLVLTFDRRQLPVGGSVLVIGRVIDRATGRGLPGVSVSLTASQDGPLGPARVLTTDAAGMIGTLVQTRQSVSQLSVSAHTVHEQGSFATASAGLSIHTPPVAPALLLRVEPTPRVAAPGSLVDLFVEVRTPAGTPVADALVAGAGRDPLPPGSPPDATLPEIRTDARGVAHFPWRIPRELESGALVEVSEGITVSSAALGSSHTVVRVRVARRAAFVTVAVAGGALVPGTPARVLARVVGPDGLPLVGRVVTLTSPLLGSVDGAPIGSATTDAEGFVAFDAARVGDAAVDECGGPTATQLTLVVGGERTALCAPVDPDAPLAITAPARLAPGSVVTVDLHRTARGAGPVIVALLRRGSQGWEPFAQEIASASASSVTLAGGTEATGDVWVRARLALSDGQVVRAAGALVSFAPPPGELSVEADRDGARVSGAAAGESVLILTRPDSGGERSGAELVAFLAGDLSTEASAASLTGLALEAELGLRVPADLGASAVLRAGQVVPQAMPEEPVELGLLRDPWRTRARFVRGRLGRVVLAVEALVESRIPDQIAEVASLGPHGWTWNREMLAAAISEASIDDEGSASLDGEPLDIDALVAMDPSFTFDHVARRITRRRLFKVVREMRELTDERDLDVTWARHGDPRTWIASLADQARSDGASLDSNDVFDAWGRAFVFRPTRRASFVPAISGWEVASLGPDGRDGTADDVFDPLVRAVPTGSLYADAVGEDALVARLSGVALGRSSVEALQAALGDGDGEFYSEEQSALGPLAEAWRSAPEPLAAPTGLAPPPIREQSGALLGAARQHAWALAQERRSYAALAIAVPPTGRPRVASATFEAGARVALRAALPEVLRVGDAIGIPIVASALEGTEPPAMHLSMTGNGLSARLADQRSEGTGSATARVILEAGAPGTAEIVLEVRGMDLLTLRRRVRVLPAGSVIATHAGARLAQGQALGPAAPSAGTGPVLGSRLMIAIPRAMARAPMLDVVSAEASDGDALGAVVAWARTLQGDVDPALAARASRAAATQRPLTDACALVALSATTAHMAELASLRARSASALSGDLRERAAVLVALAGSASPSVARDGDPVATMVSGLRVDGWRALATERDSPAIMARVAAGLLLADVDDGPGRALFHSAVDALRPNLFGERALAGDPTRLGDGWIGTLALALAARQLGEGALADELAAASMREMHLLRRTGVEGRFWALAASVYGAFGVSLEEGAEPPPDSVVLEIGGVAREIRLEGGAASVEVRPTDEVRLPGTVPVLAMLETRVVRELGERAEGPFDARIEGVLGDTARLGEAGARAALELVVEAQERDIATPVIELTLPSLGVLDEVARAALGRAPGVLSVSEPDRGSVVRITLHPLRAGNTIHVPLVLAWLGAGRVRGLGLVTYDAADPTHFSTHAARAIELGRMD